MGLIVQSGARCCGGCSSRGLRALTATARRRSAAFRGKADLPADLLPLVRSLTQRRLLVAKLAMHATTDGDAATLEAGAATLRSPSAPE